MPITKWSVTIRQLAALLVVAACSDVAQLNAPPSPARPALSVLGHSVGDPTVPRQALAPQTVTRSTGQPTPVSFTIAGYGPSATLRVANGDASGNNQVTSATITVDGVQAAGPSDFKKKVTSFDVPVTIANPSTITVQVASGPGSQLTISLDAVLATSAQVGPSGGVVHLLGTEVGLNFPIGALATSTTITANPTPPPTAGVVTGTAIDLGPPGTTFASPVTLTLGYDPAVLPTGVKPQYLQLEWWNVDHWEALPNNSVDGVDATVGATITQSGIYALLVTAREFCPTDGTAESDLQTAIADAPVAGTVWICNGSFSESRVGISKALTVRAEHPGQASLVQPSTAASGDPVILVDGVTAGSVSVMDLNIHFGQVGIQTGVFDSLSVTGSAIVGQSLKGIGVSIPTSATAPARAYLDHDVFSGGSTGLNDQQPVRIETYNSTFHDFGSFAIIYSTASGNQNPPPNGVSIARSGRVEHNTFNNCGQGTGVCVALEESGADTVRFNTMRGTSTSTREAIFINHTGVPAALSTPAVVTDNVIQGFPPTGDPSLWTSWAFGAAVTQNGNGFGAVTIADEVQRNQIVNAFAAFEFRLRLTAVSDNTASNVFVVFNEQSDVNLGTGHRNDFSGYTYPFLVRAIVTPFVAVQPSHLPAQAFTCNWWGSASGPSNVAASVPVNSYQPFATTPIANQAGVSCP